MNSSPTFAETFTITADNPLLSGHVVYGRSLLPGVGYMDLLLQVLARQGHSTADIEVRNLTILAPLVAAAGERVRTTVEGRPGAAGSWRIEIRSRREGDGAEVVHALAHVRARSGDRLSGALSLPLEGSERRTRMDEIYTWCREYDLQHSGLMKIAGEVHHRPGDWVAALELAPAHRVTSGAFLFHPALFEAGLLGGGVALGMLHGDNDGPGLYLPLTFESFRVDGSLGERCYVRVPVDSVRRDDDLVRMVVEFYDETGVQVAELGRFVAKRIRAAEALDVREDVPAAVPAAGSVAVPVAAGVGSVVGGGVSVGSVMGVVRELVGRRLGVGVEGVDVGAGYYELGLGSADLLSLVAELEERLSVELSPTVMFEYGSVAELGEWLESQLPATAVPAAVPAAGSVAVPVAAGVGSVVGGGVSVGSVMGVVRELVGRRLGVGVEGVDVGAGYYELGLGSADLLSLVAELEERLSVELSPTVMFEYGSVAELGEWLESQLPATAVPAAAPAAAPADEPVPVEASASDDAPSASANPTSPVAVIPPPAPVEAADDWRVAVVAAEVASLVGVHVEEIRADAELAEFGLDVSGLARLAARLDESYGVAAAGGEFAVHRTVRELAALLPAPSSGLSFGPAPDPNSALASAPAVPAVRELRLLPTGAEGSGVTFELRCDGDEPYLRDHQVRGGRLMPGAAHLELARAAVARTLALEPTAPVQLTDVVWLRPAEADGEGLTLRVSVAQKPGGACEFEIHRLDRAGVPVLCVQGRATVLPTGYVPQVFAPVELRALCSRTVWQAEAIYARYTEMGMVYGPSQRPLTDLRGGTASDGRSQVLAELVLPTGSAPLADGVLHPSMLDGALQSTIGLWLGEEPGDGGEGKLALPFALDRADVVAPIPAQAYAWVRHEPGGTTDAVEARLRISVLDGDGRVCVELSGLSTRLLRAGGEISAGASVNSAPSEVSEPEPQDRGVSGRASYDRVVGEREPAGQLDIAIIGVSGRYPEAADLDEFWQNLRAGRDCIRQVPADRWDHRRHTGGDGPGAWGGFLDGIDLFDPLFFRISLLEADHLDPQERLFLQCAHHTLEDAGYTGERLSRGGRVGVFVGVMYQEYQLFGAQAQERGESLALWGSASTVANRVSYVYDFHGPSLAVDTMCSSSLTSLHLACEAIRSGQCATALAGGVNLTPHPNKHLVLAQRQFLSSDGRCRSFGADGDGYVPGEGVGSVLLKPLAQAVADGDQIHAVIKGTAVNHGGRTTGYSVPTPNAQGEVIAQALRSAGVDPRQLSYLEAHGTGTSLGDPVEVTGIAKAFERVGAAPQRCAMGSVKSNIGHCESAAGIAGVTKVLLQLRHGELVPSLHADPPNPHIDFADGPLRVQRRLEPWHRPMVEADGHTRTVPRLAGVSSFGGGGSNAHVVLAEYVPEPAPARSRDGRPALLLLSAASAEQLVQQVGALHRRLGELSDDQLHDVAWTLQTGRTAHEERFAFAATSVAEARDVLAAFAAAPAGAGLWFRGTVPAIRTADRESVARALAAYRKTGAYAELLARWTEGAEVDWDVVRGTDAAARRISLPGYPFARERCWIDLPHSGGEMTGRDALPVPGSTPEGQEPTDGPVSSADMVLLRPNWRRGPLPRPDGRGESPERHVVVIGLSSAEGSALRAELPTGTTCTVLTPRPGSLDRQYPSLVAEVFLLVSQLLQRGVRRPTLLQTVVHGAPTTDAACERAECFAGLAGLLRTLPQENPNLTAQYVECLDGASASVVAARLASEAAVPDPEPEVRYRPERRVRRLTDTGNDAETRHGTVAATPWREDGVYLVTGGMGGLGRIVARDIAASVRHATVVLTGRSALTENGAATLRELRAAGLTAVYEPVDVADREALAGLLEVVTRRHGPLTGVLHAAGVVEDDFVVRKSPKSVARVLAPKVMGAVHLDDLTQDQPLDLFVSFSSLAGAFGNAGQCDYAAANAFLDAHAVRRSRMVADGRRTGRSVSVNWPLWDDGGMGADPAVRAHLSESGLAPLTTAQGLAALRYALAQPAGDAAGLLVLAGHRADLLRRLAVEDTTASSAEQPTTVEETAITNLEEPAGATPPVATESPLPNGFVPTEARTLEAAVRHLRGMLAPALGLGPERLNPDTPLDRYGMDSVLAVTMLRPLEETFGPLSRTLLFEVGSVRGLARRLAEDHPQALRGLVGLVQPAAVAAESGNAGAAASTVPVVPAGSVTPTAAVPSAAPVTHAVPVAAPGAEAAGGEEIAVIGVSGRYPQADDLDAFWEGLHAGRDCVTPVPTDRWEGLGERPWWGSFLTGIDRFDPLHFGLSPREAAAMDPQQRLFLETVWHLLEGSGVTQEVIERQYGRRVGVYVGAAYQMYRADHTDPTLAALTSAASYNLIANRVSHFFGLEGPSLAVDSMCTSSTMAIHLACLDLLRGESELAVAGGVNLTVHPDKFVALGEMQLLGSHPGSRSFRDGDGYLPAEAVGAVLLKPLAAAQRDGDRVLAVIRSTSSLHGGRASGFMTPSHRTQVRAMRQALERSGLTPHDIGYVEAAANGTAFSDEVELGALREVFAEVPEPVAVGTVKSHLGHPEAASGIAQLTKVLMQLRHGRIAPLAATGTPNPRLDLEGSSLRLCEQPADWEPRGRAGENGAAVPLRALVNSVAAGGSHVTLVVEAPPVDAAVPEPVVDSGPQVVLVSARTSERLSVAVRQLHEHLERDDSASLAEIAHTTQVGREALAERVAVVATDRAALRAALAGEAGLSQEPAGGASLHRGNAEEAEEPLAGLLAGARGEEFLAGLIEDRELERLAELWVRGVAVPWRGLHRGPRQLVPLPATAFDRGRHWLGSAPRPAEPTEAPQLAPAAEGGTAAVVAAAWTEVLQVDAESLGERSDFFALGGNSLLATRLANLLGERIGAELPVSVVFQAPKLADMATAVYQRLPSVDYIDPGDVDQILHGLGLIEQMSDEELEALNSER